MKYSSLFFEGLIVVCGSLLTVQIKLHMHKSIHNSPIYWTSINVRNCFNWCQNGWDIYKNQLFFENCFLSWQMIICSTDRKLMTGTSRLELGSFHYYLEINQFRYRQCGFSSCMLIATLTKVVEIMIQDIGQICLNLKCQSWQY